MPARDFFHSLSDEDKAKVLALFKRFADIWRITNPEKFKKLGPRAGSQGRALWEFKSFQVRFIGDFRPGNRFVVAHGVRKKGDELRKTDIEKAVRILIEHDARGGCQ